MLFSVQDLVIADVLGCVTGDKKHLFNIICQSPGQGRQTLCCGSHSTPGCMTVDEGH